MFKGYVFLKQTIKYKNYKLLFHMKTVLSRIFCNKNFREKKEFYQLHIFNLSFNKFIMKY